MENLSKDVLMLIALELDLPELLLFCRSSKESINKFAKEMIFGTSK